MHYHIGITRNRKHMYEQENGKAPKAHNSQKFHSDI